MPTLLDADGCCESCEMFGNCGYGLACECHRPKGAVETSLASINAAARDRHPWDMDPDPDGGSF